MPHHSFHVLDVHSRVCKLGQSLDIIDHCRVSWGKGLRVEGGELLAERQPLVLRDGKLVLAVPRPERVLRRIDGHGFADAAGPGDWVSLQWRWVCEVLSERQRANMERYTRNHLALANLRL